MLLPLSTVLSLAHDCNPLVFWEQPKNWLEEGSDWYKYCLRKQVFISLKIFKNNIEEMYSHNFTNSVMWAIS